MKRRIPSFLLMLILLMSMSLTVSAKSKETYFEEDGVRYCWVRGGSTEEPGERVSGCVWVAVYDEEGKLVTQLGECDRKNEPGHDCDRDDDIWDRFARLEYKWKLVVKEIMMIQSLNQEGYAMRGSQFVLLKQEIERNADGTPLLSAAGEIQYKPSEVVGKGEVERDGYARMRLDEDKLDPTAPFQQLVLGQILSEEQLDPYSPLKNRWYVNLVPDGAGEYEIYSVTLAPPVNITDPEEFAASDFGKLGEGFVSEYDSVQKVFKLRNDYRVGDLMIEIDVVGFEGEVPSQVRTNITVTGPNDYSKRLRSSETLEDMRMGEYTIAYSSPVSVEGYEAGEPVVTVEYPVMDDGPVTLQDDVNTVLLSREHANAVVNITYPYVPLHVHEFDAGVVTYPTCTEEGYTTYSCIDPECDYTYRDDVAEAYGHDYREEKKESTCTEDGYTRYACSVCGDVRDEQVDAAAGHQFRNKVTRPTCTEKGYTTYTCEKCGISYRDDEVEATGHDYRYAGDEAPTCTEDGSKIYSCLNCGEQKMEAGEKAIGHDFEFIGGKEGVVDPTCTENGYLVYRCTRCEEEKREEGKAATGHKYSKEVTAPTCTEKGYTTYTCVNSGCDYSYRGDEKAAAGHHYVSQVIKPTTEREGYTLHTCSVCSDTYTDNHKDKLSADSVSDGDNTESSSSGSDSSDDNNSGDDNSDEDHSGTGSSDEGDANHESAGAASGNSTAGAAAGSSAGTSGNQADTVIVKSVDEFGQPLSGTMVALYSGTTQLRQWSCTYDNVAVLDNLEKYAGEGESASYTLKQTKAPAGYEISGDSFTVLISRSKGKTELEIKKAAGGSQGSSVENGRDGKPIVTFRNERKTTQVEIACQTAVEFDNGCIADDALIAAYQEKQYDFTLRWKDTAGEEQTESIRLSHGEKGLLEARLPFGTEYEVTGADAEGNPVSGFSENAVGTLTTKQVDENVVVEAVIAYVVQADEALQLDMMVVDSESGNPLKGAGFELKDPDGDKIGNYNSYESGELQIADVFTVPGDYLLTQTRATEGYEPLSGAAPVIVSLAYAPAAENGSQVIRQSLSAQIAHQAVSTESDGIFLVENVPEGISLEHRSEKGMPVAAILGIVGGIGAAGAGVVITIMQLRRKRKLVE